MSKPIHFRKMHGLGNDFVIIDARNHDILLTPDLVSRIGHRHFGVGFDQLVSLHLDTDADLWMEIWNCDGTKAEACGNATRCVADLVMREQQRAELRIRTQRGILECRRVDGLVAVNMGQPILNWQAIPLSHDVDIDALPLEGAPLATGMGNPHCSFFVPDAEAVPILEWGPRVEHDPLFPARTNVQFASLIAPDHLRMRVWERGVGVTLASGSSSCATAVAAARKGITGRSVQLTLDGGDIWIDWRDDGVWMKGPVAYVFTGELDARFMAPDPNESKLK